jgi:hypothetical protein
LPLRLRRGLIHNKRVAYHPEVSSLAENQPISITDSIRDARQQLALQLRTQAEQIQKLNLELRELQQLHERTELDVSRQWDEVMRLAELTAAAAESQISSDTALENVLGAVRGLMTCTIPEQVFATLTEEAAQWGVRAATFDVRGKAAWGASANGFGPALSENVMRALIIPLNQDNPFRQVCETAGHVDASVESLKKNRNLLDKLKPAPHAPVLLLPIRAAGTVAAIFYADPGEKADPLPVNALKILAEFAGAQIDRLIALSGAIQDEDVEEVGEAAESEVLGEEAPVEVAAEEPAPPEPHAEEPPQAEPHAEETAVEEPAVEEPAPEEAVAEAYTEIEVVEPPMPEPEPPAPFAEIPLEPLAPPAEMAVEPPPPPAEITVEAPLPATEIAVEPPASPAEIAVEAPPPPAEIPLELPPPTEVSSEPPEAVVTVVESEPAPPDVEQPAEEFSPRMLAEPTLPAAVAESAPPPPPAAPAVFDVSQLSEAEQKVHKDARRFAKLLVSEIELYNKAKVADGRKNRDLYKRLRSDIDRSRQTFEKRFGKVLSKQVDYFHDELVKTLALNDSVVLGQDYPGPSA